MVKEDKSLKNFIEKGESSLIPLRDFRNWLLEIRDNPEYRDRRRRNGSVYENKDGELGLGSFSMHGRYQILKRLLELEESTGLSLISIDELRTIDRIWENEGDLTRRSLVDLYYSIKGKRLPWDEYRTPLFDDASIETIMNLCEEYKFDYDLFSKLTVAIEKNKNQTKGQKVNKSFDKIVNEGWLHYENIKKVKEDLEYEDK